MKKQILFSFAIILIISLTACEYNTAGEAWTKKISLPETKAKQMPVVSDTKAVFRCWYSYKGVANHYLSFDANCEGNQADGLIGYVYPAQKVNTRPIYQCYRQTRHDHRTYTDHFTSFDQNCEGQRFDKILGYIPVASTQETKTVYRCWNTDQISAGKFDHMVSQDPGCEGYPKKEQTYYFLKQVKYREQCTGDTKDVLTNNLQRTYGIKGTAYEITAMIFGNEAKFKINGEITEPLQGGEVIYLADGAKLEVEQVWPGEAVSFCLTAGTPKIQNLILVNDGAPAQDVVIAVDASTFLGNDITQTKLDSEVMLSNLFEVPLIVRIFISDVNVFYNPERMPESTAQNLVNYLNQNPRVTNATYKAMSEMTVRDLVEYQQP